VLGPAWGHFVIVKTVIAKTNAPPMPRWPTTTIGRKLIVATTGLTLAGWTALHMAGNLLVFSGRDTINHYGAMLQASPLVWLMRAALLGLVSLHVRHALRLALGSWRARGCRMRARRHRVTRWSARAMVLGGVVIAAFTIGHLLHVYGPLHDDFVRGDVHHNLVHGFGSSWVMAAYLGATVAFCAHLRHGLDSALRSLGFATGRRARRLSVGIATGIGLGFASPCIAVTLGILR
jgi:succinate dehydrogenase cytochrome b subunit